MRNSKLKNLTKKYPFFNGFCYFGLYKVFKFRTITSSEHSLASFIVNIQTDGSVTGLATTSDSAARPVFYLNSNVFYESGDGSYLSPYRISI